MAMMMNTNGGFSRRKFVKTSAALGAGTALSRLLGARSARADTAALDMWWWGEQELPGLQAFVDDSVKNYSAATVKTMLQDTSVVISQFQTAAAAGKAPDIQYLWNGIYHMESVWLGYLKPLNGLVNADVLDASRATLLSRYDGNIYRLGWYPLPMIWSYNKDLFDQAGLDADNPPKTWDDLLGACDKLKAKGIAPIGGGIQDGYWGEWYFGHALAQNVDSTGEAVDLFTGARDFRDPKYHEHWVRLEELKKHDFLNADMSSLELYPGIDLIVAGKLAMGESIGGRVPADSKTSGGKIGCMVMPVYGKGKMAGATPRFQGLGISTNAEDPNRGGVPEYRTRPNGCRRSGRRPDGAGQHRFRHLGHHRRDGEVDVEGLGRVREHPLPRQPGAGTILRAGPPADGAAGRAGQDHGRAGRRAGGQGRPGMARLQSGHGGPLQEVGDGSVRLIPRESKAQAQHCAWAAC
jgi:ABC-type glycerol-3-phosphate transport system substrate-binding protein